MPVDGGRDRTDDANSAETDDTPATTGGEAGKGRRSAAESGGRATGSDGNSSAGQADNPDAADTGRPEGDQSLASDQSRLSSQDGEVPTHKYAAVNPKESVLGGDGGATLAADQYPSLDFGESDFATTAPQTAETPQTIEVRPTAGGLNRTDTGFQEAGADVGARFSQSDWHSADLVTRKTYTEEAHSAIRNAYGLDARSPRWTDLGSSSGRFEPDTGDVSYSEQLVREQDPSEAIKTAAHENRHAYQWEVVEGREPEPEPGLGDEWRQAVADYPTNPDPDTWTSEEFDQYSANPLEVDARAAEDAVWASYSKGEGR